MTTDTDPTPPQPRLLQHAFKAAAVGRIVLGATAFVAPKLQTQMNAVPDTTASTEMNYLIRIFGARALGIGLGYLISDESNRRRWQRLGLLVDTLDNVNAAIEWRRLDRGDPRIGSLRRVVAVTGPYAALGVLGAAQALKSRGD